MSTLYRFSYCVTMEDCSQNRNLFIEAANWATRQQFYGSSTVTRDLSDEQQLEIEESACIEEVTDRPPTREILVSALLAIVRERDKLANGGRPLFDPSSQGFDDWAADLAAEALRYAGDLPRSTRFLDAKIPATVEG